MSNLEYLRRLEDEYAEIESQRLELDAKEDILRKAIGGLKELSALENRPVVQLIPRAAVAAALAELRASLEETSDTFDSGLESWPYDDCRIRLEKVIGGLGLVVHEDQLSETLTDSQYKEWFTKFSWLQDGVRVGLPIAVLNLTPHKETQ